MDINITQHQWKYLWLGIFVLVLISSVTGCHRKNDSNVPDDFWKHVQEKIKGKTTVFSNDDNSYCITEQEDGEKVLTQQRSDGTLIENHVVNQLETVNKVTKEWIYYTTRESEAGFTIFWRVPIQKTESGDQLVWEKKEALLRDILAVPHITDSYVIYETGDAIYKLDLQNKEKIPVIVDGRQMGGTVVDCREQGVIVLDETLFIMEGSSLYRFEPDSGTVTQIYTGERWKDEDAFYRNVYTVSCGDSIYFTCDNETIWQYRQGEEQAVCVAAQENLLKKLKDFGLKKGKKFQEYCITEIFLYQERLYFLVKSFDKKELDTTDVEACLLSAPVSDLSQLQNESAVTDYWNSWEAGAISSDTVSYDLVGQAMYVYKPVRVGGIVDGKVILEGVRLSHPARSMVETVFFAAYDPAANQVLERPDIRKVYLGSFG